MFDLKILTFIIPAYNSNAFLEKCIDSMLVPELLHKLEIIVVNDGSTDGTAGIAREYCTDYPDTVRLISQQNKGHGGALNTGCAAATGKYLKVIDADDWIQTENLPAYLDFLENCDADVVLTHHRTIDITTGKIKHWRNFPPEFGKAYTFDEIMADWRRFDRSLTFHGITYRTEFYREKGIALSEKVFYEDHEFATYPCCHAESIVPCDLYLYEYRIGDVTQSVSDANQLKRISHTGTVIRRMIAEQNQLPEGAGKEYAAMKLHGLVMSYLTIVLLAQPDRINGRLAAKAMMERCKAEATRTWEITQKKYHMLLVLNRLHIRKRLLDWVLGSWLYNRLRGNRNFKA